MRLVRVDLYNQAGQVYGVDYYAINGNPYPVYFRIYLTEASNVQNGLSPDALYVTPGEIEYVGYVRQANPAEPANWHYQWEARRA